MPHCRVVAFGFLAGPVPLLWREGVPRGEGVGGAGCMIYVGKGVSVSDLGWVLMTAQLSATPTRLRGLPKPAYIQARTSQRLSVELGSNRPN